jgi:isopentenyl-diphosphate delta-isomerase
VEEVILVNPEDRAIGRMEKMAAHEQGILHRAFSVFLFNDQSQMLLQQRAHSKYHSPSLWTNACCSHPKPGEDTDAAARRRLFEELNIACNVDHMYHFVYKADVGNGLIEHELDHVFSGVYNELPEFNTDEVEAVKFVSLDWLNEDVDENPDAYTAWFRITFEEAMNRYNAVLR